MTRQEVIALVAACTWVFAWPAASSAQSGAAEGEEGASESTPESLDTDQKDPEAESGAEGEEGEGPSDVDPGVDRGAADTAPPPASETLEPPQPPEPEAADSAAEPGAGEPEASKAPESEEDEGGIGYQSVPRESRREEAAEALGRVIEPYGAIAGGLRFESLARGPDQTRRSRHPTVAVSRIGLQGRVGDHIRFRSELEANLGGPLGYGASVWEGQGMMSIRDQYLQYDRWGWTFAAGRVTDSATVDFYSQHVNDLLGTDQYVRDPLLFSGYDRGTGLFAKYDVAPGLRAGLTFHSTNPTGLTGTLLIGGDLFPFDRPFYAAAAAVGRNQAMLPDQNLHIYFATPSVEYEDDFFQFRSAVQGYQLNTAMSSDDNERILGYNLRASARVRLLDGLVQPFLNVSRNENELLDPQDETVKLQDTYRAFAASGGVDFNYWGDNGIGIQYAHLQQRKADFSERTDRYLNIGHTFWIEEGVSLALRYAAFLRNDDNREAEASLLGLSGSTGHQSLFLTSRLVF